MLTTSPVSPSPLRFSANAAVPLPEPPEGADKLMPAGDAKAPKAEKTKKPKFYPAKPNRLVMSLTERMARMGADLVKLNVIVPDDVRETLEGHMNAGESLIIMPNHSTALDGMVLMNTGIRTRRMGARELFESSFFKRKILQWNNVFSVDRDTDASASIEKAVSDLANKQSLTAFPQGFVNWKHGEMPLEEVKLGLFQIAIEVALRGQSVKIVPQAYQFEPRGSQREIEQKLDAAVGRLEKIAAKKTGEKIKAKGTLKDRIQNLFAVMVRDREARYAARYNVTVDTTNTDYYDRLEALKEGIVSTLEKKHFGETKAGGIERRARKVRGKLAKYEEDRPDYQALTDIIRGLSMYRKGYLNDDAGRLIETLGILAHDIKGKFHSVRRIVPFLRTAEIDVTLGLGKLLDVNAAVEAAGLQPGDKEGKKQLAIQLTQAYQAEMQRMLAQSSGRTGRSHLLFNA